MLTASPRPLSEEYDLALVDLDGVVYLGPEPVPHASAGLQAARSAGMGVVFVTNNASREPGTVADQLRSLGIAAESDEVLTSAQTAVALLGDVVGLGASVLVVGGPGLVTAVREAGYRMVASADDRPDAVIQGFGPDVSWHDLAEASYAIGRGARYVVTNRDLTQPKERGIAPGNGTLVAAVVTTTGVEPVSAGKPEPAMFQQAVRMRGATRPIVIGDRLDTALGGARAGLAEGGDRAVDEGGVFLCQRWVIETEFRHHAGAEVFEQDVGRPREAACVRIWVDQATSTPLMPSTAFSAASTSAV